MEQSHNGNCGHSAVCCPNFFSKYFQKRICYETDYGFFTIFVKQNRVYVRKSAYFLLILHKNKKNLKNFLLPLAISQKCDILYSRMLSVAEALPNYGEENRMENEIVVKKSCRWATVLKIVLAVAAVAAVAAIVYTKFFKKKKKAEELEAAAEVAEAELPAAEEVAEEAEVVAEEAPFEVAADAVIDNAENMEA